jgi:hypothetical protein
MAAVPDACVLYKGVLTNFLLCLADAGLFDPVWSKRIHEEWCRALAKRLPPDKITYRLAEMDRAFPGALCPPDRTLLAEILSLCRTDRQRKDAHVAATTGAAGAHRVVTHNARDFGFILRDCSGLAAIDPDGSCSELLETDRQAFLAGGKAHRESMQRYPARKPTTPTTPLGRRPSRDGPGAHGPYVRHLTRRVSLRPPNRLISRQRNTNAREPQ